MQDLARRLLDEAPLYRRLDAEDRAHLLRVSSAATYDRGAVIFAEGDSAVTFFLIATGRVKVVKTTPGGRSVILEVFGPGDPLGAVAVYEDRPYPASAVALEPTACLLTPQAALFELLERRPTLARGLLASLTRRLLALGSRLAEQSEGRVETRFARLFLELSRQLGRPGAEGVLLPITLTRQELADFTGTTVETSIRIMSRWARERIVATEDGGFRILDPTALATLAAG